MTLALSENSHKAVSLSWFWDEKAYDRQIRYDGVFAMLTNHTQDNVSANEMLRRYRDRNQIEMNFRDLKGCARVLLHIIGIVPAFPAVS